MHLQFYLHQMIFRNFFIFLYIGLTVLLFSCDKSNSIKNKVRIGFSQCIDDHPYRDAMNQAMRVQASLSPEVKLSIYNAHKDADLQIRQIEKMIDDEMDVIIVSPMGPDVVTPAIEKAYDKGIPVIIVDRKINSEKFTSYVGTDNMEVGRIAGNYIASMSKNQPANVIELKIDDNSSPAIERSKGFHEVITDQENIQVVASVNYTNAIMHKAILSKVLDSLADEPIDYFYAFNDSLAYESWQIARKKRVGNNIHFIGIDGLNGKNGGIELVKNGILEASILYPTGGAEAIKLAIHAVKGKEVPKLNLLSTTVIDIHNVDIMKNQFDKINDQQKDIEKQIDEINKQEQLYDTQNNLLKILMTLLTIVFGLAVYSIYSIVIIRKKNKQLLLTNEQITEQRNEIERIAKEIKEADEEKFNFFTGLSHEFKTPLTLIMSSIESVGDMFKGKKSEINYEVELIKNNSNRLLRLMNNLLDYRRSEDQKFNVRASKTNIYLFSKTILNEFSREAKKRQIQFEIEADDEETMLYIDRNLMDKVYFNLLSNAFKFTPDRGFIKITINGHPEKNYVSIKIKDNGIGIPKDELPHVFEPFFKGSNNRKNSTGIGLHLSKQFVELHLGTIEVQSYHGTEFEIKLYKGDKHFNEDQLITEQKIYKTALVEDTITEDTEVGFITNIAADTNDKYTILVVEDNKDLAQFLNNKLQAEFNVLLSDGPDAINQAIEQIPDIVVCDINLPGESGFEICAQLKADLRTSHIPAIILTALSDKESYLRGLQSGADLYLTKPFSYSILIQSIKSLMYNREKLRFYYTSNIHKIENADAFDNIEQKFITSLNALIQENLGNSDFSVENLADSLNISRVQLYRKVKAIMGMSISDYIGEIRLEKAKSLLENSTLTVAEIAYTTGFSSPNYFSTVFKNQFGTTPGTYRKSFS